LYINICSSELIEAPKDKAGAIVDESRFVADGLEIPLLIGPVRPISDMINAIDVIYNPLVPKICKKERYFRGQVLELTQNWILQETKLKFKVNTYEDISGTNYKGGLGDKDDIPVLFNVDESMAQMEPPAPAASNPPKETIPSITKNGVDQSLKQPEKLEPKTKAAEGKNILSNPSSLLKELQKDTSSSSSLIDEMKPLATKVTPAATKKASDKKQQSEKPTSSGPAIVELDENKKPIIKPTLVEEKKEEKKPIVSSSSNNKSKSTAMISEKPKALPSTKEKQQYSDLLDNFEDPDGVSFGDNSSSMEDMGANIIGELAKMLVPGMNVNNTGGKQPEEPRIPPPVPAAPVSQPAKKEDKPSAAVSKPVTVLAPAPPSIPKELVISFSNSSPQVATASYKVLILYVISITFLIETIVLE
jgi:hypothetical protein